MTKTNVERTLETLVDFADVHRQALAKTNSNIDALTSQVGVLSESITRLENQVERIAKISEEQAQTARLQAESVSRLINLLEKQ